MSQPKINVNDIIKKHNIHVYQAYNALRDVELAMKTLKVHGLDVRVFNSKTGEEYTSTH